MSQEDTLKTRRAENIRKEAISSYLMSAFAERRIKYPRLAELLAEKGVYMKSTDIGARIRKGVISGFLLSFLLEIIDDPEAIQNIKTIEERLKKSSN